MKIFRPTDLIHDISKLAINGKQTTLLVHMGIFEDLKDDQQGGNRRRHFHYF